MLCPASNFSPPRVRASTGATHEYPFQHAPRHMPATRRRLRPAVMSLLLVGIAVGLAGRALAADKPLRSLDEPTPLTVPSTISAAIEFGLTSLDHALERRVPKRLATFSQRETSCWHRRILGRDVNIDCMFSGYVEQTGPVSLRT